MADSGGKRRRLGWLWLLIGSAVLTQSTLNLVRPMTSYKLLELGADATVVGAVTAVYAVLPLFLAVWLGKVSDRMPSLRILLAGGALLLSAGAGILAVGSSLWALGIGSAILGVGHLMYTIAGQSAVARHSRESELDAGFGWFTAAFAAGQLIGPLVGGAIVGTAPLGDPQRVAGIDVAMWLGVVLSLLALPLMLAKPHLPGAAARRARDARAEGKPREGAPSVAGILRVPGMPSHMLAGLALLAMIDILVAFLPVVGERAGVAPLWIGVLLAVRGGATILSRVFLPALARKWRRESLVLVSLFGSAVALAIPPLVMEHVWIAAACLAVGGFLLGLGQPLTMTLVSQSVPASWRGSALAVRLMGNRLGQVAMPLLAGVAAAPLGPAGAIWFSCAVLAVSGVEKLSPGHRRRGG
ncbi:MFS transporter [Arthrobacter sp. KK5.5]|uniref:MFS transporter n=1 Tax=Arthrobacter sp. KK5.5 TaxID=3373084 RepID=UPI003EE5BE59